MPQEVECHWSLFVVFSVFLSPRNVTWYDSDCPFPLQVRFRWDPFWPSPSRIRSNGLVGSGKFDFALLVGRGLEMNKRPRIQTFSWLGFNTQSAERVGTLRMFSCLTRLTEGDSLYHAPINPILEIMAVVHHETCWVFDRTKRQSKHCSNRGRCWLWALPLQESALTISQLSMCPCSFSEHTQHCRTQPLI